MPISPGELRSLDIGCGAGLDSIIAAKRAGTDGRVIGIDFSKDMIARAEKTVKEIGLEQQVEFHCAAAEKVPLTDGSIDIVLVYGIFNLNPKRQEVSSEIARVLRVGGKVYAAEIVFTEPVQAGKVCRTDDWFF